MRLGYAHITRPIIFELLASMRPRRMRLGYSALTSIARGVPGGFNEAEAHAPRIRDIYSAHAPGRRASMRPRRMRLGYAARDSLRAAGGKELQ